MTEHTPLRVAIIGGGIAGLAAARVLREQNDVTVYERNASDTAEAEAAVDLGPNGTKIAKSLGLAKESLKAVVSSGFRTFDQTGALLKESRMDCAKAFGSEWWMVHRQDLKDALFEAATGEGSEWTGKPAKIVFKSRVENVDPENGLIQLGDGSIVEADLIIGADGIHSKTRAALVGLEHPPPVPANISLYRFTVPLSQVTELLGEIPDALKSEDGTFLASFIAADGSNRNAVIYPCRNREIMKFARAVPDSILKQQSQESWTQDGDLEEMIRHFEEFPPRLHTIMRGLSNVKLYQLRDADPLPSYARGHVALIGDAAHPMVPYQGQGANQALEDAEALRLFLRPGLTSNDLAGALKTWDSARRPRASQVQLNSRVAAAKVSPEITLQRMRFNWTYDGIEEFLKSKDH
ncbi:6-hydroxynicotinate 3-monooxygenase [Colletotrichum viniferum]|nr:6-hydroxynicotinate 3-monooxygenase [Colletotrichum viniferum]